MNLLILQHCFNDFAEGMYIKVWMGLKLLSSEQIFHLFFQGRVMDVISCIGEY